jgi:uroporphyrinogen-III decarboxylase
MTSRERMLAVLSGEPVDRVPLMAWCFGFQAPERLRWKTHGREVKWWYSGRLEHIHTLPQPWEVEDEFRKVEAWSRLGVDDALEISVPWGRDPDVTWEDKMLPPGADGGDPRHPTMERLYTTPSGVLRHAVKRTGGAAPGWVIQPDHVPLFDDYNIPRAVEHAVKEPSDVDAIQHIYAPPGRKERGWFEERLSRIGDFAGPKGTPVVAWCAFGMDAAVWLAGADGAVLMALDAQDTFQKLLDIIFRTDYERTALAAAAPGVDIVCQRGWYSSTDFWSPALFDRFVQPYLSRLVRLAHDHGKKFAYVMTTGVEKLGPRLADSGVDLLYFVDPVQDKISLERARDLLQGRMAVAGGVSALVLGSRDRQRIREAVKKALGVLGPTRRFILQPVDALFPDTPWEAVETMIEAWNEFNSVS